MTKYYKNNRDFHKDLGSSLNAFITLLIFMFVLRLFGNIAMDKLVIAFIASAISYPLVGLILRKLGIWKY